MRRQNESLFLCGNALLVAVTLLASCGHEDGDKKVDLQPVPLFSEKNGILLPTEMKQFLGLETAAVMEKAVVWRFEKLAQVYRAANGSEPAAAMVLLHESEMVALRTGGSLTLNAIENPAIKFTGALVRFDTTARAALGQIEALIEFSDAEGRWQSGASLVSTFTGSRTTVALAVPESAVIRGAGGAFVYVANGDRFVRAFVKLGAAADGWVEIIEGLTANDVVVSKGVSELWMIELSALKGGTPCCPPELKKREK